jgi:predicted amidohydrolase YtcJ
VLEVWEKVNRRHSIRDLRWVLVHLHAADRGQLERIKRLGAVATTNPISYLWRSAADEAAKLAGAGDTLLPHRSLLRHRIPFGLATDNKPPDPWMALAAVVARKDMTSGMVLGPSERLGRLEALRALTVGGAWVTRTEREAGTLAPGRRADLAVLDGDPLTLPLEALPDMTVRLTMVGGRVAHWKPA